MPLNTTFAEKYSYSSETGPKILEKVIGLCLTFEKSIFEDILVIYTIL